MPPAAFTMSKYACAPSIVEAFFIPSGFVIAAMAVTLISVSVTPGAETGMWSSGNCSAGAGACVAPLAATGFASEPSPASQAAASSSTVAATTHAMTAPSPP